MKTNLVINKNLALLLAPGLCYTHRGDHVQFWNPQFLLRVHTLLLLLVFVEPGQVGPALDLCRWKTGFGTGFAFGLGDTAAAG